MLKATVLALGLVAVVAVVIGWGLALSPAGAQAPSPPPTNFQAVNGMNAGEVSVLWDAVDGAAFYRIGWVAYDDIDAARANGRNWLDAFDFKDVENQGQTTQLLKGLLPGAGYAFIAASVERRFGNVHNWSEWVYLTTAAADATSCPTYTGTPPPPPSNGGTPPPPSPTPVPAATTPAPTPTPTPYPTSTGAGDYDTDQDGLIEISNLAQLAAIRADLNGDGASPAPAYAAAFPNAMPGMGCPDAGCTGYELVANLDFDTNGNGEADAGDAYWNDGAGWVPIGDYRHKFTADFDGNNHTIANLYINRREDDYVGLFGYASGSSIKQAGIVSATVSGHYGVGGLVGTNYGAISDSYATGSVSGRYNVGGLVGSNYGAISDSYATGSVSGQRNSVGGLVGHNNNDVTISGSYATGSVSGDAWIGGLVGSNIGTISGSYATGSVSGDAWIGGLVGTNYGAISGSYATGSVSGDTTWIGGLVGSNSGTIRGSYAMGNVSGDAWTGGLVGSNNTGAITDSYAAGRVSSKGDTLTGGLVGSNYTGTITDSYWDTQTSGQAGSYGGVGKTTEELQSPTGNTGIYANWNADWWDFGTGGQYPALKYGGLDVTAQRP